MMGPTHDAVGATGAFAVGQAAGATLTQTGVLVFFGVLASRLPDRLEKGPMWRLKHRRVTHYLITLVVLAVGVYLALAAGAARLEQEVGGAGRELDLAVRLVAGGFAVGYLMHLVADSFTKDGTRFFGPFYNEPIHLAPEPVRVRVEGISETVFVLVLLASVVAYLWLTHA